MMSVTKEFHRLLKRVGKLTDGQASIADIDWDDGILTKFYVTITPNHGFYKSGNFKFEVNIRYNSVLRFKRYICLFTKYF
jgi:hypothetical protein